jgi:hypothetical protein
MNQSILEQSGKLVVKFIVLREILLKNDDLSILD